MPSSMAGNLSDGGADDDSDICEVSETQFIANIKTNQERNNTKQQESAQRVAMLYDRGADTGQQVRAARAAAESSASARLASLSSKLYGATAKVTAAWPTSTGTTRNGYTQRKASPSGSTTILMLLASALAFLGYLAPTSLFRTMTYRLRNPGQLEADLVQQLHLHPGANFGDVIGYCFKNSIEWVVYTIFKIVSTIVCILWPRRVVQLIATVIMWFARAAANQGGTARDQWAVFQELETTQIYISKQQRASKWMGRHKIHFVVVFWVLFFVSRSIENATAQVEVERTRFMTWAELARSPDWHHPIPEVLLRERNEQGSNSHYWPPIEQAPWAESMASPDGKKRKLKGFIGPISMKEQREFCDECYNRICCEPVIWYY